MQAPMPTQTKAMTAQDAAHPPFPLQTTCLRDAAPEQMPLAQLTELLSARSCPPRHQYHLEASAIPSPITTGRRKQAALRGEIAARLMTGTFKTFTCLSFPLFLVSSTPSVSHGQARAALAGARVDSSPVSQTPPPPKCLDVILCQGLSGSTSEYSRGLSQTSAVRHSSVSVRFRRLRQDRQSIKMHTFLGCTLAIGLFLNCFLPLPLLLHDIGRRLRLVVEERRAWSRVPCAVGRGASLFGDYRAPSAWPSRPRPPRSTGGVY